MQDTRPELRRFIEKEDSAVREGNLARPEQAPATGDAFQTRVRMRLPEGRVGQEAGPGRSGVAAPGKGVEHPAGVGSDGMRVLHPAGVGGGELTKWVLNTPPGSQQQVWVFCTPPGSQQSLGELNAAPGSQHTVWVFDSPAGCQPESGELFPPESGKPARLWMRVTVTAVSLSRRGRRAGNRVRARVLPLPGGP